jgi:hypothetical protein
MKGLSTFVMGLLIGLLCVPLQAGGQTKWLDPIGRYEVSAADDLATDGSRLRGVLTIAASNGGYAGQFEASVIPQPVPVLAVTTNADRVLIVLQTPQGLALVNMQQQRDGSFKGEWHRLGDANAWTATKLK